MNGLKKTLSIMLCVAMIASGSFMAFAEGGKQSADCYRC